jgi:EmrB/QacA subfamily drug resistance transporter
VNGRPASPWSGFSAVAVGVFMATLDGSIVNVALPAMRADLGVDIGGVELVVSVYLLAVSATLLAAGRLGDLWGTRRVYAAGMLLFTLGSGLCGISRSLPALVSARVVQALGASAMMAIAPAAITAIFPPERRGRALGLISSVVAAGLTAGPPLGGLVVSTFSWPGIFLVNLPVGLVGAFWATRALPGGSGTPGARFDLPGAAWFALAAGAGVAGVEVAPHHRGPAVALLASSLVLAAIFLRHERRAPSPLLDVGLLRDRTVSLGLLACLLSYAAMFHQTLLSPFFLSEVKGLSAGALGAMLTAVPIALSVSAPVAGWLSDRYGPRWPQVAGGLLLAAGLLSLAGADASSSLPSLAARLALEGVGMGLFQAPNNSAVMGALPRARLGSGGGMLATARNMGMVIGVATGGALLVLGSGGDPESSAAAYVGGWRLALLSGGGLGLLAAALGAVRPTRPG